MTKIQFHDDSGKLMDAHFEVVSGDLILHSRGGAKGTAGARNTEYQAALRLLLKRIEDSGLGLAKVRVDSRAARKLPEAQTRILRCDEASVSPGELFTKLSIRMAAVGRDPKLPSARGNRTKRLRFSFAGNPSDERIALAAGRGESGDLFNRSGRLKASVLDRVTEAHICRAVERLCCGEAEHSFGESTNFDVIAEDGSPLPPKAVFGVAATEALGIEVRPRHFEDGRDTRCFQAITRAGYTIVPKGAILRADIPPFDPEELNWIEGDRRLATHFRRERRSAAAREKKRAFIREHGRLYCEECGLDPQDVYEPDRGEACIEVHHMRPLGAETAGRETRLRDLRCLCANCHRIEHWKLRNEAD